jgi:hypothetical protein
MPLKEGKPVNATVERLEDMPKTIQDTYGHVTPRMQADRPERSSGRTRYGM